MHMGQHGSLRGQTADPAQGLFQRKMAGMGAILQGVDDQQVEPAELCDGGRREIADIGTIGEIADTEAERDDVAVNLRQGLEGEGTPSPSMTTGFAWSIGCALTMGG